MLFFRKQDGQPGCDSDRSPGTRLGKPADGIPAV